MSRNYNKRDVESVLVNNGLADIFTEGSKKHLSMRKFNQKEVVLYDKDEFTHLSIVIEGRLKVVPSSMEGKNTFIDYIEKGAVLGEIEYFGDITNIHTVEACEQTILLDVPFGIIEDELKYYAPFLLFVCSRLSEKLCSLSITHSKQLLMSTKARLCKYIIELADQYENDRIPIKYTEVAQRIGKSDRHIRRVLLELSNDGIIEKKGRGYILIRDIDGLHRCIEES